ncbi:MAG: lactonase family protein [Flavobacteriaceae bacterium]|nr:lactonase family protein [Flavobacteriaceae bacterium]
MIFYTGSYTNEMSPVPKALGQGIACLDFNSKNGRVELLHFTALRNPSYLKTSNDRNYLYAVEELPESQNPQVFCFRIGAKGKLSLVNTQVCRGDYPCHLTIAQNQLIVANYGSGNALSFPLLKDGGLGSCHQLIQHQGNGPDKIRQQGSHIHMVYPFGNDHMYLVDLGLDTAKAYQLNKKNKKWQPVSALNLRIELGAGARHMVMSSSGIFAFVLSEMSSEIFVFEKQKESFRQLQKISFLPKNYKEESGGAAIRLHPNGRFLYTSNRGSNTLCIFKWDETMKTLSLLGHQSTAGKTPRDFNIDPTGNRLLVANQDSNTLVVFKIDQESGLLSKDSHCSVQTPVSIYWN